MTHLMDKLELLGGGIDDETKVDIIMNSLPMSYESFYLNAIINKKEYSL